MKTYNVFDYRLNHIGTIDATITEEALKNAREELGVGVAVSRVMSKAEQAASAARARNAELDAIIAQM